ncbi:MAG: DUF2400 family protein [Candidatus Aenigmarchaeota archaeon]|nr:DUF2400 family protein [Candidatus Aenigmarchaeota archaeon]
MLTPELTKKVLSTFKIEDRPSILDAVRLGKKSKKELELWALFCACLSWGGLFGKRKLLISFYNNLPASFIDFIKNPSQDELRFIYNSKNGSLQLLGLCFSIRDLLEEYGSVSNLVREGGSVEQAIFRLAYTLRENLEKYPPRRKFNLPKVSITPPTIVKDKIRTNALKRYCMYFRWMVRDSEPDFGIWKFFDKRDLFHPVDRHVARILRRWGVLTNDSPNWFNVEKVTEYFRKVDPQDPLRFDYHLVTFGQKYCKKKSPVCSECEIKNYWKCILK